MKAIIGGLIGLILEGGVGAEPPVDALRGNALPQDFSLGQNYPNPFNPSTIIPYQLSVSAYVRLEVFNLLGQRIATLVDGQRAAGAHTAMWNATGAAGVYIYRLTMGGASLARRMVLVDGLARIPIGKAVASLTEFQSPPAPDLVVQPLWVNHITQKTGQPVRIKVTVHNQGNGEAASTTLRYYRSTNATISTRDSLVGTDDVGRLNAASDSPESIAVRAPWTVGIYYYGACVDAVIGESDTSNNCSDAVRTEVIPIGPPVVTDGGAAGGAADRVALVALYNATDGPNWRNNTNWLSTKSLSTWYGVTVSNWEVTGLNLSGNKLSGTIPSELASLSNLRDLWLQNNRLTGPLPAELGNLSDLRELGLSDNGLTGPLPPEWGKLANLHYLSLHSNALTGTLPPAWGELDNLARMFLHSNDFTGSLPAAWGNLSNLRELFLYSNSLTGSLPPELGNLSNLRHLFLHSNDFTGSLPAAWGNLSNLTRLYLNQNMALSGALPRAFVRLNLTDLIVGGTQLCIPPDAGFQQWLQGIPNGRVPTCSRSDGPQAYLTQATQSLTHPVPLVAGKPALLRVFVATDKNIDVSMPPVRATFYRNGTWVHTADIPRRETTVPRVVDEGSLSASANAEIPSSIVSPGLEMVVEIDPGGTLAPALGLGGRIPETGRMALDVREVPPLYLTLVPLLWEENPDRSVLEKIEGLSDDDDLFWPMRDLLPVRDLRLRVRKPVWTSIDPVVANSDELLAEIAAIQVLDGGRGRGHYMGILRHSGGKALIPGTASVSALDGTTMAHELVHNMTLKHAPCGNVDAADLRYPYGNGTIGAWGYNPRTRTLVHPNTPDLMSYCGPRWISDYNFSKALEYRREAHSAAAKPPAPTTTMLLWGRVGASGGPVLEPAFVVNAPPVLPQTSGPYRLTGEDTDGSELFAFSFDMAASADGDGGTAFAFALPVRPEWADELERITLSGPKGAVTMDGDGPRPVAILQDPSTGQVQGILRDWPESGPVLQTAREALPEPGLFIVSRGVPDPASWSLPPRFRRLEQ